MHNFMFYISLGTSGVLFCSKSVLNTSQWLFLLWPYMESHAYNGNKKLSTCYLTKYVLATILLSIYLIKNKNLRSYKNLYVTVTAALLIIAQNYTQFRYPSTGEWLNKL